VIAQRWPIHQKEKVKTTAQLKRETKGSGESLLAAVRSATAVPVLALRRLARWCAPASASSTAPPPSPAQSVLRSCLPSSTPLRSSRSPTVGSSAPPHARRPRRYVSLHSLESALTAHVRSVSCVFAYLHLHTHARLLMPLPLFFSSLSCSCSTGRGARFNYRYSGAIS
jgi:hypothetical protein